MNELHQLVLVNDLAGRDRQISSDFEHRGIRLADFQMPAAALEVLRQHMHAAHEVVGVRGEGLAQKLGIGQDEIGGRQRIGDLAHVKFGFLLGVRIQIAGVSDELVGPLRG